VRKSALMTRRPRRRLGQVAVGGPEHWRRTTCHEVTRLFITATSQMSSKPPVRGAGEDWSCEPLREFEEAMNASQPAAAAASVGPGGAAVIGFGLPPDATRPHPGGRQTSGRAI